MDGLAKYVNETILTVTSDGRIIVGNLKGYDQAVNLILSNSHERIFSTESGMETVPLGLYIIRGDTIAVVGLLDAEKDDDMDWTNVRVEQLNEILH